MIKEQILLALKCCSEFYYDDCPYQKYDDCPYQKYDDRGYTLKCIHKFTTDLYDFLRKEEYYGKDS